MDHQTDHLTASPPTPPLPRRVARTVPAGTTEAVLLHVLREALDPGWTPLGAAHRLLERVHGDLRALRVARARLAAAANGGITVSQARALATLNIAIADLEEREDGTDEADRH